MKILVAIESDKNAKTLAKTTLKWAPRAGFNMRIFLPNGAEIAKYLEAIAKANYDEYLDMHDGMIVVGQRPEVYAREQGFDLLLLLPDNLKSWTGKRNMDKVVIAYATDIGAARVKLARAESGARVWFNNGALMKKL